MLEETGTVVAVREGRLWVETQSRSICSHCTSGSCTTSAVSKLFGVRHNRVQLENSLGAKVGERVVIGIPDDLLVRAAILCYLLPLMIMVMGAVLGSVAGASEGVQSLMAVGGLAVGFLLVRWGIRSVPSQQRFQLQLLRYAGQGHLQVRISTLTRSKR